MPALARPHAGPDAGPEAGPDAEGFARLTEPLRPELLAHCYRMLGSVHDAEDQVQETLIRAWRSYGEFEGRSSLRTWLYRIATNACLRAIENRARRPLPSGLGEPNRDPEGPLAASRAEALWLQPFPDALLVCGAPSPETADPADVAVSRQSMRLALIAALQFLPARQRAVLILRDVLRWRAAEVAELLGTSTAAVNSVLQRARAQLGQAALEPADMREPAAPRQRALLGQYAAAFENADVAGLTRLLREDAVFEMPPQPAWFTGREVIGRFLASRVLVAPDAFRMLPTAANGQPAFAVYQRGDDGRHWAHGIQVLGIDAGGLRHVVSFNDPGLVAVFGLPASWPGRTGGPDG
jgi:RNA polymerase sigma-70 factor (ECF subfamily)